MGEKRHLTAAIRFRFASLKLPYATLLATSHSRNHSEQCYQQETPNIQEIDTHVAE